MGFHLLFANDIDVTLSEISLQTLEKEFDIGFCGGLIFLIIVVAYFVSIDADGIPPRSIFFRDPRYLLTLFFLVCGMLLYFMIIFHQFQYN
jgi:hypothetical protein